MHMLQAPGAGPCTSGGAPDARKPHRHALGIELDVEREQLVGARGAHRTAGGQRGRDQRRGDLLLQRGQPGGRVVGQARQQGQAVGLEAIQRGEELRAIASCYLAVWVWREAAWQLAAFQGTTLPVR